MNITFALESSFDSGGMERMLATIANALAGTYNVTVLTAFNEERKDFFPFKENVRRVDLGIERGKYPKTNDLKREYKKRLGDWLMCNHQDVTVSLGSLEFFFLPDIKDGSKKVFWFHFAFNYDLMTSRYTRFQWLNSCIGHLKRWRRIRIAKRYDNVVVLSRSDLRSWRKHLVNVSFIYNPITISPKPVADYGVKRAMAVGRIEYQKGFDFLVQAWTLVREDFPDWQLDIYGSGTTDDVNNLQALINTASLQGIVNLKGRTDDIANVYSEHSLMILSSRYEGFGLVLVEAAACGLPLVSFDCEQGPSEIIENGKNGYLVSPVGNVKGLADAIRKQLGDEERRKEMGSNAMVMAERFSLDRISKEWMRLFGV